MEAKDVARDLRELLPSLRESKWIAEGNSVLTSDGSIQVVSRLTPTRPQFARWIAATSPARLQVLLDRLEEFEARETESWQMYEG